MLRLAVAAGGLFLACSLPIAATTLVEAEHDSYRYKWPYLPGALVQVTGYPLTAHHGCPAGPGMSCTDAWDLVISGGDIRSSAEGTAYFVRNDIPANTCDPLQGLGNNVKVGVPDGRSMFYGHLASTPVIQGSRILQGDYVGLQGHTGHTVGSEPGGCGTHLHFEYANPPGHPSVIDGQSIPGNVTNPGPSTNVVGAFNQPGGAIRQEYFDIGVVFGSWTSVGWTADSTGSHAGCGSVPLCRIYVHYHPDPVEGHWGSRQDFRLHPGPGGLQYQSIMTGRWANSTAFLVDRPFLLMWLLGAPHPDGGANLSISMPLTGRIDNYPNLCEAADGCVHYQRSHIGYIWEHTTGGMQQAVFCPDVALPLDYRVRVGDITVVSQAFNEDDPAEPYEAWSGARYDITGDGRVRVTDINLVNAAFNTNCYP